MKLTENIQRNNFLLIGRHGEDKWIYKYYLHSYQSDEEGDYNLQLVRTHKTTEEYDGLPLFG